MGVFDQLIAASKDAGIFAFYLPFLITFALLYGLLNRVAIFGPAGRVTNSLNVIIAFSVSLFVIGFTPAGITLSGFFGQFFQQVTITILTLIVGIIALVLLGETLGPYEKGVDAQGRVVPLKSRGFEFGKYTALVLVLVIIGVFINSGGLVALGLTGGGIIPGLSTQDMAILAFIILTGLLVYWVTGGK